jgi:HlyD family secretion protein
MYFCTMDLKRTKGAAVSLLVLLAAGGILTGCGAKAEPEVNPTVTVQVDGAEKGTIQRKVVTDAVLYPKDQAAIVPHMAVPVPVAKWFVDKGSHVKSGQVLGELENQDLAGLAVKSRGGYEQAQVTYEMQKQKTGQDLTAAKQTHKSSTTGGSRS